MHAHRLSESEYSNTFQSPMRRVPAEEGPPFDFWPYVDLIPQADYEGHDCSAGKVRWVYQHPTGRYEHVLISSENKDIFMVLVLDRKNGVVLGHRLLNLLTEYGLET
jgi:hypothetical protein